MVREDLATRCIPSGRFEFEEMWRTIDVRSVLASVQAPTLVIATAGSGDLVKGTGDVARERYLVEHIAGAKYVELPGRDFIIEHVDPTRC